MSVFPDPGWPPADRAAQQRGVQLLNDYRVKNHLQPLSVVGALWEPAAWKARNMAALEYVAHDDPPQPLVPQGRTAFARDEDFGYTGALGEIIAWGTEPQPDRDGVERVVPLTPETALEQWLAGGPGEGHYEIIRTPDFNACGYGVAVDTHGPTMTSSGDVS